MALVGALTESFHYLLDTEVMFIGTVAGVVHQSINQYSYNQGKAVHVDITLLNYDQLHLFSYSAVYGARVEGRAIPNTNKLKQTTA